MASESLASEPMAPPASAKSKALSAEFWAIVGSAIALGLLMATLFGGLKEDIRAMDARLSGRIESMDTRLRTVENNTLLLLERGAASTAPGGD